MQREYDLPKGVRVKFYREGAELIAPVYLDPKIRAWLTTRAQERGTTLDELVNELLSKDIELIEAASRA